MKEKYDVYIGRWNAKIPVKSKWHNPFRDGTKEENIAKFKEYLLNNDELLASLHELKGKILGCWCAPSICHGDVLAELVEELFKE